jgi:hypothetical protein
MPSPQNSPIWVARSLVRVAMLVVPRGPIRDRYIRELHADLGQFPPRSQFAFSVRVLRRAWGLRAAVSGAQSGAPHKPVLCQLNVHHDWRLDHTDDGGRFWRCRTCGKDDDGLSQWSFGIDCYRPGRLS